MSVWLTFFFSVLATAFFFGVLYGLICLIVASRRRGAAPKIGIASGETPGTLTFWAHWAPNVFALQIYRLKISFSSPDGAVKEGQSSVTFDPPQKSPFAQPVELPQDFRTLLERGEKAILSYEIRTVENLSVSVDFPIIKLAKTLRGDGKTVPSAVATRLKPVAVDPPVVSSLEWTELQDRKKKIKDLMDQAKAKEQKAAQAAAAAAAAKSAAAPAQSAAAPAAAISPQDKPPQHKPPQEKPLAVTQISVLKNSET